MSVLPPSSKLTACPVLYQDAQILAVHKPAGVLSHPNTPRGVPGQNSAFEGPYDLSERRFETPAGPLWLIHRLDQDASGILLAAKDAVTMQKLRKIFEEHQIEKDYVVLFAGILRPSKGTWRDALDEKRAEGKVRAFVLRSGKPNAELHYEAKETYVHAGEPLTLAQVRLVSGRTHQIRVQSSYRDLPVAGDEIYGRFTLNRRLKKEAGLKRLFLHAFRLAFKHPITGKNIEITDLLPDDLDSVLARLKQR